MKRQIVTESLTEIYIQMRLHVMERILSHVTSSG